MTSKLEQLLFLILLLPVFGAILGLGDLAYASLGSSGTAAYLGALGLLFWRWKAHPKAGGFAARGFHFQAVLLLLTAAIALASMRLADVVYPFGQWAVATYLGALGVLAWIWVEVVVWLGGPSMKR